jgi:hypothetical protein
VCATCEEHFTRRYSATRHNFTIHDKRGEIVPLLEYIVGRKIGRYRASHPFWFRRRKRIQNLEATTVGDSMGDAFTPGSLQQQTLSRSIPTPPSPASLSQPGPLSPQWLPSASQPQPQPPDVSPYPTGQIFQPVYMRNDQGTLPEETILKIQELKRLMYRYSQYHSNPGAVINCIVYYCINGDNSLLGEKLEQLRSIDAIKK